MWDLGEFSQQDFIAYYKVHKDNDEEVVTNPELILFIKKVVGV